MNPIKWVFSLVELARDPLAETILIAMKIKTKDRILDAALELFNAQGLEAVSTRQIAQHLQISQGNLCYHFPHKDQIVGALYQRLVDEFNRLFARIQSGEVDFGGLMISTYVQLGVQYRYKFLMLNFVQVMRQYPEIQSHFQALFQARQQQFAVFFENLLQKGWLRSDIGPEHLRHLVLLNFIAGNFWMADAEILYQGQETDKVLFYTRLLAGQIWPYLSPAGLDAYQVGCQALEVFLVNQEVPVQA